MAAQAPHDEANLDLPLITEATNDYYRAIYADPDLGPIFRGINMVVLRTHVSFFIHQVSMFDAPMTARQLEYLRKVHTPIIEAHAVTQRHFDAMLRYMMDAMRTNGAQEPHLVKVQAKLMPLRELFPPQQESDDGHVTVEERAALAAAAAPPAACPLGASKAAAHAPAPQAPCGARQHDAEGPAAHSRPSLLRRLFRGCLAA